MSTIMDHSDLEELSDFLIELVAEWSAQKFGVLVQYVAVNTNAL